MGSKCRQKVTLNVGGTIFQCYAATLKTFENSILAKLDDSCENFDRKRREFFFDRSPRMFDFILDAHRTGILHFPKDMCGTNFKAEMKFWGISTKYLSPCCWSAFYKSENDVQTIQILQRGGAKETEDRGTSMQNKLWRVLNKPKSSRFAKTWAIFISFVVIVSLLLSAVETLESTRNSINSGTDTDTKFRLAEHLGWSKNSSYLATLIRRPNTVMAISNVVCYVILTLELVMTIVLSPTVKTTLGSWFTVAGIVCCLSFWTFFVLQLNGSWKESTVLLYVYVACKDVQLLRLIRLYRVGKHISAFRVLGLTFKSSKEEMKVLALMLFILTTLFGTSLYLVEATSSAKLENLFDAMYWALITLTTVGYGDYVPTTSIGRVITCACAVCGILMLVIPVGIVTTSFHYLYEQQKNLKSHEKETATSCARNIHEI